MEEILMYVDLCRIIFKSQSCLSSNFIVAGKTLVPKEKVFQLAEQGNNNKIYHITLDAVDRYGKTV